MKEQKKQPQQLALVSYEHQGAEAILEQTRVEVTPLAIELSEEFAEMNRPTEKDTSIGIYFGQVTSALQSALEKILGLFGADAAIATGASLKQRFEEEVEEKKHEHTRAENQLRNLKGERKKLGDSLRDLFKTWRIVGILTGTLVCGEIAINWRIFTLLTGNVWLAIISAAVLSLALLALIMVQDKLLEIAMHIVLKIVVVLAMTGLVLLLLQNLAEMRMSFLTATNQSIADQLNPLTFIIINATFYIAGMGLSVMFRPSADQKKLYKKQVEADNEIVEKEKQAAELKRLYSEDLPRQKDAALAERYSIMMLAQSYAQRVEALHQELFTQFVSMNLRKRTDGVSPPVFSNKPTITYQSKFES